MTVTRSARRSGFIVLAALALALSACSGGTAAGPATGAAGTTAGAAGTTAESGPGAAPVAALDFTGTTLDGSTLDAVTLSGTPVVLWFWAPWCTICRAEAPDVAAVAAEFDGRVRVLGVPGRGEIEAMRGFVSDTGTAGITHVTDVDGALWNRFGVVTQPAFVFVDRSGSVQSFAGSLGGEALREMLAGLA